MILIIIALCGIGVHIASYSSRDFAETWHKYVNAPIQGFMAILTSWIPFSLGEVLVICLPAAAVALIVVCVVMCARGNSKVWKLVTGVVGVAAYIYILFAYGFAAGYNTDTLDVKLNITRTDCSAEELYDTALILLDKTTGLLDDVKFLESGDSDMPYSLDEMNELLNDAYSKAAEKYDFIPSLRSNVKYIMLSEPMSYTHITGVYTLYTGEANINVNFPDYTLPFTAAHELSHQRGINREDEANFMAFLVSLESDDPYILYSAYQNMFEYVISALYSADKDLYFDVIGRADERIIGEMVSYNTFYDKYKENKVADVAQAVNDSYIKASGQPNGTKSYGMVVDLAVAYYR